MTELECQAGITTTDEWLQCSGYMLDPVMSAVSDLVVVAVTLAIIMTGLIFVRRVVREFGRSA
jgi:hypothetical protein